MVRSKANPGLRERRVEDAIEVHKLSVLQFLLPCGTPDELFLGTAGCGHEALQLPVPTGYPSFLALCSLPRVTTMLQV